MKVFTKFKVDFYDHPLPSYSVIAAVLLIRYVTCDLPERHRGTEPRLLTYFASKSVRASWLCVIWTTPKAIHVHVSFCTFYRLRLGMVLVSACLTIHSFSSGMSYFYMYTFILCVVVSCYWKINLIDWLIDVLLREVAHARKRNSISDLGKTMHGGWHPPDVTCANFWWRSVEGFWDGGGVKFCHSHAIVVVLTTLSRCRASVWCDKVLYIG